MAIESREILRTFFQTADIPTQDEFYDFLDSYVHKLDDGVTVLEIPGSTEKKFGIGTKLPAARLGVQTFGTNERAISFHRTQIDLPAWGIDLNPTSEDRPGFNIDQVTPTGPQSRFFIKELDGHVGIGTTQPTQKLHLERSTPSGLTGMKLINTANAVDQGWILGQVAQNATPILDGAFCIFENEVIAGTQMFTILSGGKVGIAEQNPNTKLHISAPILDPNTDLDLISGTGIVVIGPMSDNIVADYRGLQARQDVGAGLVAATFNLQRLGGNLLIHGDSLIPDASKVFITGDARLGLGFGELTPVEKIDVNGAIRIGDAINTNDGTIRYNGADFEGRKAGLWVSLTQGNGPWSIGSGNTIYYNIGTVPRVGIGESAASASLHINDDEAVTTGNTAAIIHNHSTSTSSVLDDNRIGLEIKNNGLWGGDPGSKNIGLYISDVQGQTTSNYNIAAMMNGNVVIGHDTPGMKLLGESASNVLSIQNGAAPLGSADVSGVQLYSANIGIAPDTIPALHIMSGDGDLVKLYREVGLPAANNTPISGTYGSTEEAVINNLRSRLNELEQRLMNIGILGNPVI